jgi:hypothetical protein
MKTLLLPLLIAAALPLAAQTITTGSLPNGVLNSTYSAQLSCNNCQSDTYGLVNGGGNLPNGLNLSPGGTISGIPSAVGTYNFTVGLFSSGPQPLTERTLTITIPSGLTILTTSFANGQLGTAYAQTLAASGGVTPYTWSITQGALPPGLGIATNNSIVGTPTATGTFTFTLSVFDAQQNGAFVQTSITVAGGTTGPAITTSSLPNGIVAVSYTTQLTCVNCAGYTWSLSSGNLPLGLTINSGGTISGTPTEAGTASFQITLSAPDPSKTTIPSISQIYTLTVNSAGLGITQTTLPIGFSGTPYSTTLTGTGGLLPYTWSFTSTTGNDGLTIGAATGTISGTPTSNGTFIIGVTLADSSGLTLTKQFTLSVSTGLSVLTTSLPNGSTGTVYPLQQLSAGGGQPPYRWSVTTGTLPPGLTLDGVFGRISGTPTTNGNYPFTLTVTDNTSATATGKLSITIGAGVTITIAPATLPAATVGTAYSQTLTATGGTAPYTWSLVSSSTSTGISTGGTLPPGLTLNASSGAITGTPTTAGTYAFTIQATDSTQATGQQAYSVVVSVVALSITTSSLPDGTIGTAYSQTLAAAGGTTPYAWSVTTGSLPAGLTLNSSTGAITGTPTAAGSSPFTVQVADSSRAGATATKALSIAIASPLTVTPSSLPGAVVGTAYTQAFTAAGGKAPYTFALTGTLPAGFTFTAATGTISGTAPSAESANVTLTVTDASSRTVSEALTLTATAPAVTITIAPATLPAATAGTAYSQTLTATGGTSPYKFALTTGSLPSGLSLSTTGSLTGTASAAASATFTVTATDANNATGTRQYTLTVNAATAPTVTLTGVPATSGFQQQLAATPTLSGTFPSAVTGTVVLTFTPSVTPPSGSTGTIDDNMIQFSGGAGRNATFTVPAGSTTAPNLTVLTGTTAGTITLTTTLSSGGTQLGSPSTQTIVNAPGVPFISKVLLKQVPGGVTVTITGFSSTRDMTNASFQFAPATGDTFTSDTVSVPVQNQFNAWYANTTQSNPFGTQFTLTVPFTLATPTQSVTSVAVVSVTVTLQNSKGASNAVTISQ